MTNEKHFPKTLSQWEFDYGLFTNLPKIIDSNSEEISYLSWQNKYPNFKTTCHIKLKFILWTKLLESLLLGKYLISVAAALSLTFLMHKFLPIMFFDISYPKRASTSRLLKHFLFPDWENISWSRNNFPIGRKFRTIKGSNLENVSSGIMNLMSLITSHFRVFLFLDPQPPAPAPALSSASRSHLLFYGPQPKLLFHGPQHQKLRFRGP